MTALRTIKLLLAGIIALFAAATVYTSVVIGERQEALRQTSRYNVAWLASQATTEFARFVERVSSLSVPGSGVDADEVQLRFEILLNRLKLFENGDFRAFADTDPEHQRTVQAFADALPRAEPLVASIDRPGAVLKLREVVTPLEGKLARLAAAANRYGGELAAEDQKELLALHWTFSALAIGLICCGFALIGLLLWHNTLLGRAQRRLNALASDLRHASDQLNAALNNMSQGLCMVDKDQRLTVCNAQFVSLFDLPAGAAKPGRLVTEVFQASALAAGELHGISRLRDVLLHDDKAGSYVQELGDGRTIAVSHQPMADGGWVATYEDITDRRQAEARIAHLAHHDVLTDLPNRALFLHRLEEALARVRRHGESVAVISLDLDRFMSVNDTLGHPVGDKLLCEVARRLIGCLRETDTVARFGGDEFAILQIGREQPRDADALARRIADVIGAPYDLDGNEAVVGTSLGISVAPGDGLEADELLKNADMALYRAKSDGRGAHRFFEAEMDAQLQARRLMELDLRQALARDEFELHYQPLVNLRTNAIVGYEALLRWRHPERGMVSPALFIPVAEEIGLISAIGEWVIREACDEAASWPDHLKVAVNLSPVQFRGRGLVPTIVSALAASGLPAHRLELEITESVLLQDNEATLATLHQMRSLGTRIAMDDFGTGFSSLSYLRSFPFDKIKIDRSFVRDSGRPDCLAIVQSVASLAANLHMSTTAEGIETAEQLERVREAGCTEGQGFLFARPKPSHELAHVFEAAAPPHLRVVRQRS
jgi:diguanylate cyclase (GGDEF)-like protein